MTSEPRGGQGGFSSERQRLLKLLLRDKGVKASGQAPITRRPHPDTPARLSFAQQRLWIIDRLEPGSASYNIPLALRLNGRLDRPALLAAMAEVVRRHEALRTTFAERDGIPVQVVHPLTAGAAGTAGAARAGAVADLAALPAPVRDRELRRLAREEASRPFDLQRGPLARLTLLHLGEADHALLVTMHHIVSDGWSAGVFVREMTALYQAFAQGLPSPLPELAIQYPDFAEWQRSWLSGDTLAEQLGYWRGQLAGAPLALELPTDRPRPTMPDGRGGSRTFTIDRQVTETLNALCRREEATPFMGLLAAFGAVLGRHAGQRDLVVGSPIANRNRAEIEGLIGFFVNSLALRVDLAGDPTFGELLARVRGAANGAYAHQDLPFERLVEELHPERELGRNPVFQVVLALQNAPRGTAGAADLPDLALKTLEAETGAAQFDLMLDLFERPEGLLGRIGYALELFDAPTVDGLANHFGNFLAAATADPGLPLSRISCLSAAERHQLVLEWGTREAAGQDGEESVLEGFEAQAACSAGAIAIRRGDDPEAPGWTYGELDRAAEGIAKRLRSLEAGTGVRVGLMAGRAPEAVAALLGIWKAGAAYVPLDPDWPAARLELVLGDSGVRVLLTQEPLIERLAGIEHGAEVLLLEDMPTPGDTRERLRPRAYDLAYLIYTSGTTGAPKAVMVEHGSLLHILRSVQPLFGLCPGGAVTCLSPFSFDVSLFELLAPLLVGGTLVLMDLRPAPDLGRVAAVLEEVEVFHAVPSLMRQLVETVRRRGPERFTRMRTVCLGGEAVPPRLLEELAEVLPWVRLWVLYGPTEATIFATAQQVREGDARRSWPGTWLGRPLPGLALRMLDADGQPVPVGVAGELYLGGPSVARGYLGRAALTAEKFLEIEGGRFYRTGDLARFLPDGRLVYLGRADDQVKVRGFRIELGEVEAALAALPGVRQAAVVARGEGSDRRLAAFVVAEEEADTRRLRDLLRASLPEYMVPGEIVAIDALPLSPTGKVDRRALAEAAGTLRDTAIRYEAPRTAAEQLVAQMWADLLSVETVGVHDHFFDLGGHSLLATQVVSRVREVFRVELPLRALFEAPTVEALAARVEAARLEAQGLQTPPIVPVPREGNLPLSFAQERLWLFDRIQPGLPAYNIPQAMRWRGPLRVEVLERVLDEIVGRHEALRTRIGVSASGEPVQVIDPELHVPVPVVDLQALPGDLREAEAGRQAEVETWQPFDLIHGPVLRACVLRLAPEDHVTVFTRHHIAFDGWSNDVFSRELAALYEAFSQGRPSPLPPLPVQYADFAVWQRRWLSGEVLERQLGWWRERLAGAPTLLQIPTDRPRPAVQGFRGVIATLRFPVPRLLALEALCRREGVTPFMALLAAWKLLLSRYGAGTDLVVGSPVANRHRLEVEGLIGFFANTLVLRTDLSGDPTVHELLGRVRETALGAYEHQDTPFERLIEELRPERSLSHTPLFQVLFAMNELGGDAAPAPAPGALSSQLFNGAQAMSRYDLELYVFRGTAFLELALEYRVDLFDRTRVERMLGHLSNLLASMGTMAADPDLPASGLSFLSAAERHQLLADWNDTHEADEAATDLCLPDVFAAQAGRTPDAVALSCDGWSLTYDELDRRTDHAAALLADLGVGPESVVAVLAERGPELPVALLAIQKAGGAWLPLDPSHPEARLAQVIERSGACCVLGTKIRLEDLLAAPARPRPDVRLRPENLAYLIYTSGSTGTPKGVMVEHRGMLNHLRAKVADLHLTAGDVVAQTASHSFDISVWQSFAALLAGGRVQLFRDQTARDPGGLLDGVEREQVTVLQVVPSWLGALCEVLETTEAGPSLAPLRWLFSTGEALSADLCRRWLAVRPGVPMINGYGPTEASDNVSHALDVRPGRPGPNEAQAPIGRPLPNLRLHVTGPLPGGLLPVPIGVSGELCVGGVGVGRGYQDDPARTAEAFVPDPFAAGARLYRTGDLARFLPDGTLEYLGRRDRQIKVRGFRIETGEIEAALLTHPGLRQAAVVARHGALVAYVVPRSEGEVLDLRAFLKDRLPEYMVPVAFVTLPALPLNANGKVDLSALPDPETDPETAETPETIAPRTPLEALIAEVWREVLRTDRFGVRDNFFELGGDSIKGAILMHRLQRRLGETFPVLALFNAPTVEQLAAHLAVQLEPRLPAKPARRPAPLVPHLGADGPPPLSFAQERLWFLQQLDPAGAAYNLPNALRLRGRLDVAALERAVREIVDRHETLRTRFALREGFPVPVVEPVPALLLPLADLTTLPEAARSAEAGRLLTAEALRPFDLERGPVARHLLLRLAPEEHAVLFAAHHIACDGWSLGLWAREVQTFYQDGRLPALPVQYGDFAAWQRSWLVGEELTAQVEFWRERLRGAPPFLDLPADHPRPPVQTFRGGAAWIALPGDLLAGLKGLALRHNASLFMVLLAGFQLLLGRLAGQDDLVVGSPIAGRVPEVEGLIGCFLNTLALRADLSGDPSFAALLGQVRETALAAYAHQDVPFEKLLQELRPERDLSRTSVFQVLFNMLNTPGADVDPTGLAIEPLGLSETAAKFDLTLYVAEDGEGLLLNLVYNADLFERPRMEEMLRQYRGLLVQAGADPDSAISRYTLITPEAAVLLPDPTADLAVRWPGAAHELVAEQARLRPGHPALVDRDGTWTYAELDRAARHLAARLLAEGIEPGDRVAIYAHRGAALAWAVLGVMRAGAVFVLFDPAVPAPRLLEVLRLAGPRGWLRLAAVGPLPEALAAYLEQVPLACRLDLPLSTDPPLPGSWPTVGPDDPACLSFTSGSTGEPKGILQTHGGMTGFLPWHEETLGYGPSDRHTMLSGLAHDPLQRDLFYCLGSGGTLCVPDPGRIGEPGWLAGWMRRERITVTNLTPAMAQLLTDSAGTEDLPDLPDLRCAVLGGDILTRSDIERLRRLAPRAALVNVYGSTESHRALGFHFVKEEDHGRQVVPLGIGQPGSQLLVLTRGGLQAGVGELGEISIRSPRLAAGYWQDEALTRERFISDRYCTGDLGRYLPNGEVEAAGRADQQVKVRGYRVEPGEVEAELCRLPGVREAAVAGRDDWQGCRRLIAWVVLEPAASPGGLRDQLRERLPAYMVPSVFVELEKLPLNPSGKVDRRALPEPAEPGPASLGEQVAPRDVLELRLARIWEEVLGLPSVGVTESFFDLGGHSLLAVRLMARIAHDLGRTLPLAALFQAPTVAELAAFLRDGAVEDAALVPLHTGGSRPPLFLVHPVGGQVFSYVELARRLGPDQPVYALQDVAPADAPRSLAGLASRYLPEVRAVQPTGPYLLAGWSFGGRIAWEMSRQLAAAGEEVAFLGLIDTGLVSPPARQDLDEAALLTEVIGGLPLTAEELRREADPLAALIEKAREDGTLPPGTTPETARRLLAVLKAHLEVARTDRPQPYGGKLTFFAATEQPAEISSDPAHGWGELAGELEVIRVPGDHVTLITRPENVQVLARRLARAIEVALGGCLESAVP